MVSMLTITSRRFRQIRLFYLYEFWNCMRDSRTLATRCWMPHRTGRPNLCVVKFTNQCCHHRVISWFRAFFNVQILVSYLINFPAVRVLEAPLLALMCPPLTAIHRELYPKRKEPFTKLLCNLCANYVVKRRWIFATGGGDSNLTGLAVGCIYL